MAGEVPLTPQEMLRLMIERGAPALAIENQRRLCGLPATERPEPKIILRPLVAVSAPRRRSGVRKTRKKITKASAATSKSRVATRFDLDFNYD